MFSLIAVTAGSPCLFRHFSFGECGEVHRFHHLSQRTVCQQHSGHLVNVGQVKCLCGQGSHFLYGRGRQNQQPQIPVTNTAGSLIVVGLRGLNTAEPRAAALHIDDQTGQVTSGDIGDPFALQGNPGRGGGGHNTGTACRSAHGHIDGGHFTFRLQAQPAHLGHPLCHIFCNFRLGGDGITEVVQTTGGNGGFCDGFVPLHQNFLSHFSKLLS